MLRPKKRQKFSGFVAAAEPGAEAPSQDKPVSGDPPEVEHRPGGELLASLPPEATAPADMLALRASPEEAAPTLANLLGQAEKAAAEEDVEGAFGAFVGSCSPDGEEERELLERLREALSKAFPTRPFELQPSGAFVTGLRRPNCGGREDLELILLFYDGGAEAEASSFLEAQAEEEEPEAANGSVLDPIIAWLRAQPSIMVKDVNTAASIPSVVFETQRLAVEISVQNPFGLLGSWHLRDLVWSGWSGRLQALAQLVKAWAAARAIDVPKDGLLSPYGYELLAAAFLQDRNAIPALLPWSGGGPYLEPDDGLRRVLEISAMPNANCDLWRGATPSSPDESKAASWYPTHFFSHWLDWLADPVLAFADACADLPGGCGRAPLHQRHIVSVRDRTQEELREDLQASPTSEEDWAPEREEVFLLVEDPLSGVNIGRSVSFKGFCAIRAEVQLARKLLEVGPPGRGGLPNFQALLDAPPVRNGSQRSISSPAVPAGVFRQACRPVEDRRNAPLYDECWNFAKGNCRKGSKCKWVHKLRGGEEKGSP